MAQWLQSWWCGKETEREFTVVIYESDYRELCSWVLKKPDIETGGDLFGLWADKYTAVVQLVVGPGKGCRRTSVSFYQDVNYLKQVGSYLTESEGLCHIGEWHSHHTLGLARPSGGDENTVWSNMPTYRLNRFVIFIANINHCSYQSIVNVGCFLFEIDSGNWEKPVLKGKFHILQDTSPMRFKKQVRNKVHFNDESPNTNKELVDLEFEYDKDKQPTVSYQKRATKKQKRKGFEEQQETAQKRQNVEECSTGDQPNGKKKGKNKEQGRKKKKANKQGKQGTIEGATNDEAEKIKPNGTHQGVEEFTTSEVNKADMNSAEGGGTGTAETSKPESENKSDATETAKPSPKGTAAEEDQPVKQPVQQVSINLASESATSTKEKTAQIQEREAGKEKTEEGAMNEQNDQEKGTQTGSPTPHQEHQGYAPGEQVEDIKERNLDQPEKMEFLSTKDDGQVNKIQSEEEAENIKDPTGTEQRTQHQGTGGDKVQNSKAADGGPTGSETEQQKQENSHASCEQDKPRDQRAKSVEAVKEAAGHGTDESLSTKVNEDDGEIKEGHQQQAEKRSKIKYNTETGQRAQDQDTGEDKTVVEDATMHKNDQNTKPADPTGPETGQQKQQNSNASCQEGRRYNQRDESLSTKVNEADGGVKKGHQEHGKESKAREGAEKHKTDTEESTQKEGMEGRTDQEGRTRDWKEGRKEGPETGQQKQQNSNVSCQEDRRCNQRDESLSTKVNEDDGEIKEGHQQQAEKRSKIKYNTETGQRAQDQDTGEDKTVVEDATMHKNDQNTKPADPTGPETGQQKQQNSNASCQEGRRYNQRDESLSTKVNEADGGVKKGHQEHGKESKAREGAEEHITDTEESTQKEGMGEDEREDVANKHNDQDIQVTGASSTLSETKRAESNQENENKSTGINEIDTSSPNPDHKQPEDHEDQDQHQHQEEGLTKSGKTESDNSKITTESEFESDGKESSSNEPGGVKSEEKPKHVIEKDG